MAHRCTGGQSKADGKFKLVALLDELCEALHTSATYTVRHAVRGLVGERARWAVGQDNVILSRGARSAGSADWLRRLRHLTVHKVKGALVKLSVNGPPGRFRSSAMPWFTRSAWQRLMIVGRNVASLVSLPAGTAGHPSRSLTAKAGRSRECRLSAELAVRMPGNPWWIHGFLGGSVDRESVDGSRL